MHLDLLLLNNDHPVGVVEAVCVVGVDCVGQTTLLLRIDSKGVLDKLVEDIRRLTILALVFAT